MGQTPSADFPQEDQKALDGFSAQPSHDYYGDHAMSSTTQNIPFGRPGMHGMHPATDPKVSSSPTPSSLTDRVRNLIDPDGKDSRIPQPVLPPTLQQVETVPTAFKWNHGGRSVFVTGSFNKWQGKILMNPSEDVPGEFTLVIDIPPGVHQYKFIVDEEWRLNPDYPTVVSQGVVNNTVEVKRPVFEDTRVPFQDSDDEAEYDEHGQRLVYGQRLPPPDGYIKDPPRLPPHMSHVLLNEPIPNNDPLVLNTPQHVVLNHLYMYSQAPNSNVDVTAITQRFRTTAFANVTPKFVTTVFYSPKQTVSK